MRQALVVIATVAIVACSPMTQNGARAVYRRTVGRDPARYPMRLAGVFVGVSTGDAVRRYYGAGFFVEDEGHTGGLYYIDKAHSVTLHVVLGVDQVVEEVSLSEGLALPDSPIERLPVGVESERLDARAYTEAGVRLGVGPEVVMAAFGPPDADQSEAGVHTIKYVTDFEETPPFSTIPAYLNLGRRSLSGFRLLMKSDPVAPCSKLALWARRATSNQALEPTGMKRLASCESWWAGGSAPGR
jgi:hypothetical protein